VQSRSSENLSWMLPPILKQIRGVVYKTRLSLGCIIPTADGSKRPIGVPAVIDRAVRPAMAKV